VLAEESPRDVSRFVRASELAKREDTRRFALLGQLSIRKAPAVLFEQTKSAGPFVCAEGGVRFLKERELGVEAGGWSGGRRGGAVRGGRGG
jgi:hypothetical protein